VTAIVRFDLLTPSDLLRKLQHDFSRLSHNPANSYAAFDFFVTGLHMVDWMNRSGQSVQPIDSYETQLWGVCNQLGNGLKHFHPTKGHVSSTGLEGATFDKHTFASVFEVGHLVVHLDDVAAKEIGQSVIDAVALAAKVLHYWESKVDETMRGK
jgi:hypothetical protein